jgi:hypothetical protein
MLGRRLFSLDGPGCGHQCAPGDPTFVAARPSLSIADDGGII